MKLPHDLDAERAILGAVLLKNAALDDAVEQSLEPSDFFDPAHGAIFRAMLSLAENKTAIDLVTLSSKLRAQGDYDSIGGAQRLTGILEGAFSVGSVGSYVTIVRERSQVRQMISAGSEIAREGLDASDNPESYIQSAEAKIFAVSDKRNARAFVSLSECLLESIEVIEEKAMQTEESFGLPTGFRDVDRLTGGLHPGQVTVLAARPGIGKTSFALNVAYNAAVKKNAVVAVFSLEMTGEELTQRILSFVARIDSRRLKSGKLSDRDWPALAQAADQMSKARLFIDQQAGITISDLSSRARRLKRAQGALNLIVIDYLQLMKPPKYMQKGNVNETQQLAEISKGIKELAKELRCPIILLSQLNRQTENDRNPDKRPSLSHLRGSGAIEQDADAVVFIHRPGPNDKDGADGGMAELIWAKNRHGEQATIPVAFLGQYTLFADLAETPGPRMG